MSASEGLGVQRRHRTAAAARSRDGPDGYKVSDVHAGIGQSHGREEWHVRTAAAESAVKERVLRYPSRVRVQRGAVARVHGHVLVLVLILTLVLVLMRVRGVGEVPRHGDAGRVGLVELRLAAARGRPPRAAAQAAGGGGAGGAGGEGGEGGVEDAEAEGQVGSEERAPAAAAVDERPATSQTPQRRHTQLRGRSRRQGGWGGTELLHAGARAGLGRRGQACARVRGDGSHEGDAKAPARVISAHASGVETPAEHSGPHALSAQCVELPIHAREPRHVGRAEEGNHQRLHHRARHRRQRSGRSGRSH